MTPQLPPEIVAHFRELQQRVARSDPANGEPARRELLDFARTALGRDRPETAVVEVDFTEWLTAVGRSAEALDMARHAVSVLRRTHADTGLWYGRSLLALGEALDKTGDDTAAMDCYRLAHHDIVARAGETHPLALLAALDCAEVLRIAHDFEAAERWFRRVLAIEHARGNDRSAKVAHASNNLAETLLSMGRADEAVPLADDALAIRVELFGARSQEAARSRGVVALVAATRGDDARLKRAFDESREESDPDSVTLPVVVIAAYLAHRQRHADAVPILEAAIERLDSPETSHDDSTLPDQHIDLRFRLAEMLRHLGRTPEALQRMREAFELETIRLSDEARVRSRRQMRNLLRESRARLGAALRLLVDTPDATDDDRRDMYRVLQERRALETRLLEMQKLSFITDRALTAAQPDAVERAGAHVTAITASLQQARAATLEALMALERSGHADRSSEEVIALREHEESLERALAGAVGQRAYDWAVLGVYSDVPTVDDDAAVVEYVLVESPEPSYFAFVLTRDGVQLLDLGAAAPIDEAIHQLRSQVIDEPELPDAREPRWRRRARFVGNRLLVPLLPWLDGVQTLHIVPDGALFSVPFDLLALDDGATALERWRISHLWHGGELNRKRVALGSLDAPGRSVVVAAPDTAHQMRDAATDDNVPAHRFAVLPFADAEGGAITALIDGEQYAGPHATRAALLAVENPEILHLATHSFWIERSSPDSHAGDESGALLFRTRALLDDPLQRSGIALAGADADLDAPTAASPGILFAADILDLDLRQTDLVVMSSCQSGIGDPGPGDGVQGLRRAFRAAGAESVVSSLWKVPDEATSELMRAFYQRLLARQPRSKALHEAKREMFARYPGAPLRWAGFVLDGADGPLFRFSPIRGLRVATLSAVGLSLDAAQRHIAAAEWAQALESLAFVMESDTADDEMRATAALERAKVFHRTGRSQEALAAFDALIADVATPAETIRDAVGARALTRLALGDFAGSYLDYSALLARDDLSPYERAYCLVNRAAALDGLDRPDDALADCDAVLSLAEAPVDQQLKAQLNRADLLRRLGRVAEAATAARALAESEASAGSAERATAYLVLAMCALESDDVETAKEAMRGHLRVRRGPAPPQVAEALEASVSCEALEEILGTLFPAPPG